MELAELDKVIATQLGAWPTGTSLFMIFMLPHDRNKIIERRFLGGMPPLQPTAAWNILLVFDHDNETQDTVGSTISA